MKNNIDDSSDRSLRRAAIQYGCIYPQMTYIMMSTKTLRLLLSVIVTMLAAFAGEAAMTTNTFTSDAVWPAPAGVTAITVECWGGGGAGGGMNANYSANRGGGGAGGQYARRSVSVTPGQNYAIDVGAGGTGSTGNGGIGGDSTFAGTTVVAKGGAGGICG